MALAADALRTAFHHITQMDQFEKSHGAARISCGLDDSNRRPRSSLVTTAATYRYMVHQSVRNCSRVWLAVNRQIALIGVQFVAVPRLLGDKMKAIELSGLEGPSESLRVADVEKPEPGESQILIEVKAAGINFAELELTSGRYPAFKPLPYVLGFEAAGIIAEVGSQVKRLKVGDAITTIVSSGGYAEYATADANLAIPVPIGISFAEASTIPIQGLSAYALLKFAAKPQGHETVLIQAAAGGVGLFLVQLAKIMGVKQVIALASAKEKLDLVKS